MYNMLSFLLVCHCLFQENVKRKELEERTRRRKLQLEEDAKKKAAKKGEKVASGAAPVEEGDIIENLMGEIRGGFKLKGVRRKE